MNQKEKIEKALTRIEEGLDTINTNEDWLSFLRFQARFYNYSFNNTMLILMQNPEASFVKGFRSWNKLGRQIKKGAKGIMILCPCIYQEEKFKEPTNNTEYQDQKGEKETHEVLKGFRVGYVFDIADTVGDDSKLPVLVTGLRNNSEAEEAIYAAILQVVSQDYTVTTINGTSAKGSFNRETKVIQIRPDLSSRQRIKTLLHEFAHAVDFQMNPDSQLPRNQRELVAESAAFVVASRLGIDTGEYSLPYLESWLVDRSELQKVASTVQKVSQRIITMLAESKDSALLLLKEDLE